MIDHQALCGYLGWCVLPRGHEGGCSSRRHPKVKMEKPPVIIEAVPEPPSEQDLLLMDIAQVGEGASVKQKFAYLKDVLAKIVEFKEEK